MCFNLSYLPDLVETEQKSTQLCTLKLEFFIISNLTKNMMSYKLYPVISGSRVSLISRIL